MTYWFYVSWCCYHLGVIVKAITLSPKVPVYWTNRALCHMRRKYVMCMLIVMPSRQFISHLIVYVRLVGGLNQIQGLDQGWRGLPQSCSAWSQLRQGFILLLLFLLGINQVFFAFGLVPFLALFYTCVLWQAHYMLGLALLEREDYSDGVKALQRVWILLLTWFSYTITLRPK